MPGDYAITEVPKFAASLKPTANNISYVNLQPVSDAWANPDGSIGVITTDTDCKPTVGNTYEIGDGCFGIDTHKYTYKLTVPAGLDLTKAAKAIADTFRVGTDTVAGQIVKSATGRVTTSGVAYVDVLTTDTNCNTRIGKTDDNGCSDIGIHKYRDHLIIPPGITFEQATFLGKATLSNYHDKIIGTDNNGDKYLDYTTTDTTNCTPTVGNTYEIGDGCFGIDTHKYTYKLTVPAGIDLERAANAVIASSFRVGTDVVNTQIVKSAKGRIDGTTMYVDVTTTDTGCNVQFGDGINSGCSDIDTHKYRTKLIIPSGITFDEPAQTAFLSTINRNGKKISIETDGTYLDYTQKDTTCNPTWSSATKKCDTEHSQLTLQKCSNWIKDDPNSCFNSSNKPATTKGWISCNSAIGICTPYSTIFNCKTGQDCYAVTDQAKLSSSCISTTTPAATTTTKSPTTTPKTTKSPTTTPKPPTDFITALTNLDITNLDFSITALSNFITDITNLDFSSTDIIIIFIIIFIICIMCSCVGLLLMSA
jgi:hypothetical protein